MKKILCITLLNLGLLVPAKSEGMLATVASYLTYKTAILAGSAIAATAGIAWLRTPDKTLATLEQLNPKTIQAIKETKEKAESISDIKKYINNFESKKSFIKSEKYDQTYQIDQGIAINKNTSHVCIVVDGYMHKIGCTKVGRGNYLSYLMLKANIVDMPCITFDCITDTRQGYSFGGKQDTHNIQLICDELLSKNPNIKITLLGNCKGATTVLRFLQHIGENNETKYSNAISSVIVESPPISLDHTMRKKMHYFATHYFFRFVFPNYDYNAPTILSIKKSPKIPILFLLLENDMDAPIEDATLIINAFKKAGNSDVHIFKSSRTDIEHGNLGKDKDCQKACHNFQQKFVHTK